MWRTLVKKLLGLLIVTIAIYSSAVSAQGIRFGIDYMQLTTDIEGFEAKPSAVQFRLIKPINNFVDIEGDLAFGISDDAFTDCTGPGCSIELSSMLGFFGIFGTDSTARARIYGKAGFAIIEYEDDLGVSEDDSGIAFGIGGSVRLGKSSFIVLEYNQLPDLDVGFGFTLETTALSLGFQTSF